jgi:hypothetical protein
VRHHDVIRLSPLTRRAAVSRNASTTAPAKLLAVIVVDTDDKNLTTPLK